MRIKLCEVVIERISRNIVVLAIFVQKNVKRGEKFDKVMRKTVVFIPTDDTMLHDIQTSG